MMRLLHVVHSLDPARGGPSEFVRQLQLKAGVPPGYWPEGAHAFVYTAREFGGPIRGQRSSEHTQR